MEDLGWGGGSASFPEAPKVDHRMHPSLALILRAEARARARHLCLSPAGLPVFKHSRCHH